MNNIRTRLLQYILEAGLGLFLALLIVYIISISSREATFVYQGF